MGIFSNIFQKKTASRIQLVTQNTQGYFDWGDKAYDNDIVRACVNARAKRFCKLTIQHVRETVDKEQHKRLQINPEPYLRLMFHEPNPYMSMVDLLSKVCKTADLSGNAFILILRDENGVARELFPIPAKSADIEYNASGNMTYKFIVANGSGWQFPASDIIHLREDYSNGEIFGDSKFTTLKPLCEVVQTTDKGIINAIKNSNVVRWLLKYTSSIRPEDLKRNAKEFADNYLNISNGSVGVAAIDAKVDATQINPQDYVPNATQMQATKERIYALFNTNEKIVKSIANENEEKTFYETNIEPLALALQAELTRKLFTPRERGCGNSIVIGSFNLSSASISTKLGLQSMVDRGAMTPNEWRDSLGLGPVDGGDEPIRRLDTQPVATKEGGE